MFDDPHPAWASQLVAGLFSASRASLAAERCRGVCVPPDDGNAQGLLAAVISSVARAVDVAKFNGR
jgi:hypothetical protein